MKINLTFLFSLISAALFSQANFPPLSAAGSISQQVGFTTITVDYERPSARGRKVFGELVPYGEVWRTGAGKCTRITFGDAVMINDMKVDKGTYSLFTIPEKDEWTIILNSDTSLYGAGRYDVAKDVIRIAAKPESSARFFESFTIDIDIVPNNAVIYLSWEETQVRFFVDTGADNQTVAFIDTILMNGVSDKVEEYAAGVEYFIFQGKDLHKALVLIDLAIERNPRQPWYYKLKVDVLEKQGNYSDALLAAMKELDFLEKHGKEFGWDEETLRVALEGTKSRVAHLEKMAGR
jgi:tetratricopeptide (TPR) repeat protein